MFSEKDESDKHVYTNYLETVELYTSDQVTEHPNHLSSVLYWCITKCSSHIMYILDYFGNKGQKLTKIKLLGLTCLDCFIWTKFVQRI